VWNDSKQEEEKEKEKEKAKRKNEEKEREKAKRKNEEKEEKRKRGEKGSDADLGGGFGIEGGEGRSVTRKDGIDVIGDVFDDLLRTATDIVDGIDHTIDPVVDQGKGFVLSDPLKEVVFFTL